MDSRVFASAQTAAYPEAAISHSNCTMLGMLTNGSMARAALGSCQLNLPQKLFSSAEGMPVWESVLPMRPNL